MPKAISGLKALWELYFGLVNEVLEWAERYGLQGLSKDWAKEKKRTLERYLAEIDRLSDSLSLPSELRRPRLCFWDMSLKKGTPRKFKSERHTVTINLISDILREYKLAKSYNTLNRIKHNLRESYGKFAKELDALEATLETPAQQKIQLPDNPTIKDITTCINKHVDGKPYSRQTIWEKISDMKDIEPKGKKGKAFLYDTNDAKNKIVPHLLNKLPRVDK